MWRDCWNSGPWFYQRSHFASINQNPRYHWKAKIRKHLFLFTYLPLKTLGTPSEWKDFEWKGYSELVGPSISQSVNLPQGSATQEILPSPLLCKSEVLRWFGPPPRKAKINFPYHCKLIVSAHHDFDSSVFCAHSWSWKKNRSVIISSSASLATLEKFKLTS